MSNFTDAITEHVKNALTEALQPFEGCALTPTVQAEIIEAAKRSLGIGGSVRWLTDEPGSAGVLEFDQQGIRPALTLEEITLLRQGKTQSKLSGTTYVSTKVSVIKLLRERTGVGLKDSKDSVDEFLSRYEYKL
jgi:hypothetical protein